MNRVASFDVFDTLLTRRVAAPTSLFLLVGERAFRAGWITLSAAQFRVARIEAEAEARHTAPGREVGFEEIHRRLAEKLAVAPEISASIAHLELEIEADVLVPVPGARAQLAEARRQSTRVLYVSDMYLPAGFIRAQLARHDFWQDGDRLYVSSEWAASKADGSLFRKLLAAERLSPEHVHHTGDREQADCAVPASLGFQTRHSDPCKLTRYEQMLEDFSGDSVAFTSLIAGASRLARLHAPATTDHLATLTGIATSLISPVITCYALWLLRETRKRGLQRLYFVARDGYLVKRIADALIKVFGLEIETRYLYGSRQAWHLPAITDFSPDSLSWLFEKTRTLTLRLLLGRVEMTPEQLADVLNQLGWPVPTWDLPIDEAALARLKEDLLGSTAFRSHVQALVLEKRELALRYLTQEGLFDSIPWAMVDLGWHGRLQYSLDKLLGTRHPVKTLGLYFGLYADSPALRDLQTASYLNWDLRQPAEAEDIPALVFLMESFCTAPHGSTIGYREAGGEAEAICREAGFAPLEAWGLPTVHAAVERFAEELEKMEFATSALDWDSRPAVVALLGAFSRLPLPSEARAWGAFPYEDEQAGVVRERLTEGHALTLENLRAALTFGEEQYLPASWNVLWRGAQPHILSTNNTVLKLALRVGRAKRMLGRQMRQLLGAS